MISASCGGGTKRAPLHKFGEEWVRAWHDSQDWWIRSTNYPSAAGMNLWSPQLVERIDNGWRLTSKPQNGKWRAAEVARELDAPYQRVRAIIDGPLTAMPANAVLGVFLYRSDESEMDIEFTRWSKEGGPTLHFTVHTRKGHFTQSFALPENASQAEIEICHGPKQVSFYVLCHGQEFSWVYNKKSMPDPAPHGLPLNLWPRPPRAQTLATVTQVEITQLSVERCSESTN